MAQRAAEVAQRRALFDAAVTVPTPRPLRRRGHRTGVLSPITQHQHGPINCAPGTGSPVYPDHFLPVM